MNPFFNWLKDTGTQAMLVLIGTAAAIVAAWGTIRYGRKSLAAFHKQVDREELDEAASIVSIKISGQSFQDEPLEVHLVLQDETVTLEYIEMLDASGTRYGGGDCILEERKEPDRYVAELESRRVVNWANAGEHLGLTSHLWLRVTVSFRERSGQGRKKMPVVLRPSQVATARKTGPVWEISGEV